MVRCGEFDYAVRLYHNLTIAATDSPGENCPTDPPRSSTETTRIARRYFLGECGVGIGSVALATLLGEDRWGETTNAVSNRKKLR